MKVYINSINISDADKIAAWKSDKNLSKSIMSNYNPISITEAEEWVNENTLDNNQKLCGIYIETEGILIGIARLMFIDFDSGVAELGIYIGDERYRGKGVGKSAMKLLIELAFKELLLNKIFLKVNSKNIPAIKLYKKLKFISEGTLKEHYLNSNNYEDIECMSIFKEDYYDK